MAIIDVCRPAAELMRSIESDGSAVASIRRRVAPLAVTLPDGSTVDALTPAPPMETYGANALRGFLEGFSKLYRAQEREKRRPNLSELTFALVQAKRNRLGKNIIAKIEKQIAEVDVDDQEDR